MTPYADTPPVATSLAGEIIVYFVFPLLVILAAGAITALVKMSRTVNEIRAELKPDGEESLRSMVIDQGQRLSRLEGRSDISLLRGGRKHG